MQTKDERGQSRDNVSTKVLMKGTELLSVSQFLTVQSLISDEIFFLLPSLTSQPTPQSTCLILTQCFFFLLRDLQLFLFPLFLIFYPYFESRYTGGMKNFQIVFTALYCHLRKMAPKVKITLVGFTIMKNYFKSRNRQKSVFRKINPEEHQISQFRTLWVL